MACKYLTAATSCALVAIRRTWGLLFQLGITRQAALVTVKLQPRVEQLGEFFWVGHLSKPTNKATVRRQANVFRT
jgi:hypothetical protein